MMKKMQNSFSSKEEPVLQQRIALKKIKNQNLRFITMEIIKMVAKYKNSRVNQLKIPIKEIKMLPLNLNLLKMQAENKIRYKEKKKRVSLK